MLRLVWVTGAGWRIKSREGERIKSSSAWAGRPKARRGRLKALIRDSAPASARRTSPSQPAFTALAAGVEARGAASGVEVEMEMESEGEGEGEGEARGGEMAITMGRE